MSGKCLAAVVKLNEVLTLSLPFRSGKKRKDTVLICLSSDEVDEGKIALNKGKLSRYIGHAFGSLTGFGIAVARNNLRVKLGDLANVHACNDIKYGQRVHILPFDDSIEGALNQSHQ